MAKEILTDTKIKTSKPKKTRYGLNDGDGLWLFIYPGGKKKWAHIFTSEKKQKIFIIGDYPTFSLSEARVRLSDRKKLLADIRLYGKETFLEAATIWYESWVKAEKPTKKTEHTVWTRLSNHVFPKFGLRRLSDISVQDSIDLLLVLRANELHSTARYVLMDMKRIYRDAITRNSCGINPVESIKASEKLGKYKKWQRPAITAPDDLKILIEKIDTLKNPLERYALQLIMIFATRTKELLSARWKDFDIENKIWRIPAETMKGREEHIVPLPTQSLAILESLKQDVDAGEWLFFENGNFDRNLLLNPLYRLGYKGKMCGHGFRSTFATLLREVENENREFIEKQLAHKETNATVRAYDRSRYLEGRILMMQKWADYLDTLRA